MTSQSNYFDEAASSWDAEPRRIELMRVIGEGILRQARPTPNDDVLDYGCGTGLVGLYLLPHVRSVTGADSSPGMLAVLQQKIQAGGLRRMMTLLVDLERDPPPPRQFHLIVSSMVLHHVADVSRLLVRFHELLLPGGGLALADLDSEPGVFHAPEVAPSVRHHGFDRAALKAQLTSAGFTELHDETAHVVRKPLPDGPIGEFPVFLITGRRT
ncbi:MAG: class I SAM-dependent DNA methyltransferase [Planctomycetota bacterium]